MYYLNFWDFGDRASVNNLIRTYNWNDLKNHGFKWNFKKLGKKKERTRWVIHIIQKTMFETEREIEAELHVKYS